MGESSCINCKTQLEPILWDGDEVLVWICKCRRLGVDASGRLGPSVRYWAAANG